MKLTSKLSIVITIFTLLAAGVSGIAVYVSMMHGEIQLLPVISISLIVAVTSIVATVLILNHQIMGPIRALSAAVARISLGDLSQTVSVHSQDELGSLSKSFNEMTYQLGSTHRSLEASTRVAQEGRAQLVSSINGLHQGFILVDIKNKVTLANAAAVDIVYGGLETNKNKQVLGLSDIAHVLPADLNLEAKIAETLKAGSLAKFPGLPLGGRFLNLYLSPVLNGKEAIGCVLLLEDVTEERILERSRDEFFSIASHELRTPLTAIRGNTSMMQEYFPELLKDPSVKGMIDDIHGSTVRLIEIVNDFLDTSRLEQNKMKFTLTVFSLEPTIEKTIYEMSGLSRDKNITLNFENKTLEKMPFVYADSGRITQIVYNLIGNAMKFTEKGGVTVRCMVEGAFVKVEVSDTGIGISPEGQQILFHKFQQSTASTLTRDNTRGTGLGLYISKLLIEHMGGSIKFERSELGKGSTFSFSVPVATKEQIESAKTTPPAVSALGIDS